MEINLICRRIYRIKSIRWKIVLEDRPEGFEVGRFDENPVKSLLAVGVFHFDIGSEEEDAVRGENGVCAGRGDKFLASHFGHEHVCQDKFDVFRP